MKAMTGREASFLAVALILLSACSQASSLGNSSGSPSAKLSSATPSSSPSSTLSGSSLLPTLIPNPPGHRAVPPDPSLPKLRGQLFWHSYTSYETGDGQLWQMDLASGRMAAISAGWPVENAINPHVSPDGKSLVFMADQASDSDLDWDVFLSRWTGTEWAEPTNLTGPNGKADEDPKFSPDGTHIVFKIDGAVTEMALDGTVTRRVSRADPEAGQPYYLPDGRSIMYSEGSDSGARIVVRDPAGKRHVLADIPNTSDYYPIGADDTSFFFTNVQDVTKYDRIMRGFYDGSAPIPLFFDSNKADSSDPYPYEDGSRYLFYVSDDAKMSRGGYDLQVADLDSEKAYSLSRWNPLASTALEEVGIAWSGTAMFPSSGEVLLPDLSAPPGVLLSEGKPATAISSYPGFGPQKANDGVLTGKNCWCVASASVLPSPYWQVNLTSDHEVSGLVLRFYPATPDIWYYSVQTSLDGMSWSTVIDARDTGQIASAARFEFAEPVAARFVRVVFNSLSAAQNWPGLVEAQVYGT